MKTFQVILAISILSVSMNVYAIPQVDREALIALYESTDGDNWVNNTGWKDGELADDGFAIPGTECGWFGVQCFEERVSRLWMYNNQMTGSIPAELGNLTGLISLSLSSNQLTDAIPPELGNLTSLTSLYLSSNQLTGAIPSELGNLTSLTSLYLYDNQLTDAIPSEFGKLTDLTILHLSDNQLTGPIPDNLLNLTDLGYLNICDNYLFTDNEDLRDFLEDLQPGWEDCQLTVLAADFNSDGDVDGSDLHSFAVALSNTSPDADINDDGSIDSGDIARFAQEFGRL